MEQQRTKKPHFLIKTARGGRFRVYTMGGNGEVVQHSEALETYRACETNIKAVMRAAGGEECVVHDRTNKKLNSSGKQRNADHRIYTLNLYPHPNQIPSTSLPPDPLTIRDFIEPKTSNPS